MATIQPKGENIRRAVKWISEQREENPDKGLGRLIQEACRHFNLTPKDEVYLESFYHDNMP